MLAQFIYLRTRGPLIKVNVIRIVLTIGGPIPCVVSYRDQYAHKHTSLHKHFATRCVYVRTDLYVKLHSELGRLRFLLVT